MITPQRTHIDIIGSLGDERSLECFARKFLSAIGVSAIEERESSNYIDGCYFRGRTSDMLFTISISDFTDHPDLPFWIHVTGDGSPPIEFEAQLYKLFRNKDVFSNFRFAKIVNPGRKDEQRLEII